MVMEALLICDKVSGALHLLTIINIVEPRAC